MGSARQRRQTSCFSRTAVWRVAYPAIHRRYTPDTDRRIVQRAAYTGATRGAALALPHARTGLGDTHGTVTRERGGGRGLFTAGRSTGIGWERRAERDKKLLLGCFTHYYRGAVLYLLLFLRPVFTCLDYKSGKKENAAGTGQSAASCVSSQPEKLSVDI